MTEQTRTSAIGSTALMIATENENYAAVLTLLAAGAKVNLRAKDGCTALDRATKVSNAPDGDDIALAALLRKHGAQRGQHHSRCRK